ncbi:heterokaryon incompatibility protein-domain-containing protein [Hypoxylon trugodes]|uniref:heterokaryon incompatibility protein-domain-containing protein n=1 Tax=Hypoxylon trugodes TaxID=326681 RepID=UPI00219F77DF|nr:heterokaryon incompatibility protein-domain-containing protein [Hypoxylon trugodes]KAI1389610.1 heterokaryon incompatibility protein-domain-containing protein [Hypoxylon trugodes]
MKHGLTGGSIGTGWTASKVQLARRWLNKCLETHEGCTVDTIKRRSDSRISPTYLIRIEGISSAFSARLVDTEFFGDDVRYLALSHCWGDAPFMTLTSDNIANFRAKLPCEDLTFNQTFRDAFKVTLDLGYNYIWIDSLCIVQNSPTGSHWTKECPKVGHIHMNSDCNVSATGYKDGLVGFLNQTATNSPVMKLNIPDVGIVYMYHQTFHWELVQEEPLMQRGWVLQEHFLAPRVLHFTPKGLFWECSTCVSSEIWTCSIPRTLYSRKQHFSRALREVDQHNLPSQFSDEDLLYIWYRHIVSAYVNMRLGDAMDWRPFFSHGSNAVI